MMMVMTMLRMMMMTTAAMAVTMTMTRTVTMTVSVMVMVGAHQTRQNGPNSKKAKPASVFDMLRLTATQHALRTMCGNPVGAKLL